MAPVLEEVMEKDEELPVATLREVNVWITCMVRMETWPAASVELLKEDRTAQPSFECARLKKRGKDGKKKGARS